MRISLQLAEGLQVTRRTEVGDMIEPYLSIHLPFLPRIGELVSCKLPAGWTPRDVRGRVKDIGHFTRPGFVSRFLWGAFARSTRTVVLIPDTLTP
jgi:hypothetical protein